MGRLTGEKTASGGSKGYLYNELNLRRQLTNARGQITSFDYDDNGNVWRVRDSHGNITRTFDELNRVTSYTDI
jgi:YD repeat-containing protein